MEDFNSREIKEGDMLSHPNSGQIFVATFKNNKWYADYMNESPLSTLALQVDQKGQACLLEPSVSLANIVDPKVHYGILSEYNFLDAIGFEDYTHRDVLTYITGIDGDGERKLYYALDGDRIVWQS